MARLFKSSIYIRKIAVKKAPFSYCNLCTHDFTDGYGIGVFRRDNGIMQLMYVYHFNCFKKYLMNFKSSFKNDAFQNIFKEKEQILKELEEKYTPEMVAEKL